VLGKKMGMENGCFEQIRRHFESTLLTLPGRSASKKEKQSFQREPKELKFMQEQKSRWKKEEEIVQQRRDLWL